MPAKKPVTVKTARPAKAGARKSAEPLTPAQLAALSGLVDLLRPTTHAKVVVVLHPEQEGGYSVEVPALRGCYTEGDTLEEALANAREAILLCLDEPAPADLPEGTLEVEIEL